LYWNWPKRTTIELWRWSIGLWAIFALLQRLPYILWQFCYVFFIVRMISFFLWALWWFIHQDGRPIVHSS
jgi:hypothetical protein